MRSKVGLAVFGLGRMGLHHVKNILMSPRASLKWIVCDNIEDANVLKEKYNLNTHCVTPDKADQALDDSSVDAVMIVSPTGTHENLILNSLNTDKYVFCEKPLTPSVQSTRACYELAESKGRPLLCAFQRRFDPSFYSLYKQVRSGSTGPVRIVKATSRDFPNPPVEYLRTSGGIFKDSTIHDLDMVSWIAGSKPVSVFAHGHAHNAELKKFNDNDQVVVVISYENGAVAVVDNGRWCPFGYDQRLEVLCEKMQLSVDNKGVNHLTTSGEQGTILPKTEESFMDRYPDAYRNELEHFLNLVEGKEELRVSKGETIQAMRLAELCYESIDRQKPVPYSE
ncbi:myo-inositol 2-dehydrogenase-like [Ruditapes philippinarum]|uniref:myo-inositol 2-dehydrogenase-like n=1 Tax=Ruditapes philippinarum TaxID=129788 RepID=UPI00295BFAE1|nr:myo-inositol 2-dehydrogenase-like [Ruditapes philippinarum]XP_060557758.1 myo-inositol 2-dehydrogenase-like [Ruditapes philippinarum]